MKKFGESSIRKILFGLICGLSMSFSASAAEYGIDIKGMHAFVQFRIVHLGYSVLLGRFNDFGGSFNWDKSNPGSASINVEIKTASIDSNHAERDKHLREEDFLDVEKYPTATFKSTKYHGDTSGGKMDGVLTLHGVSKPVTLDVKVIGEGDDPWGGYRAGFEATTKIRRADFGMDYNLGPAAETMDFDLFIEGVRK
ncbi:MAG: YceI family protein [Gammaproteobacteria bacterium]|nr:YceI family protein [Gammaproteobacteria bacterium]